MVDLWGLAIGVAAQYVVALLYAPFQHHIHNFDAPSQKLTGGAHGGGIVVVVVAVVILAPAMEELFFRGLLFKALARLFTPLGPGLTSARGVGVVLAVIADGLLFGLAHGEWVQLPGLALLGAALAAISYKTGGLGMNMAAHSAFNLVAVVTILNQPGGLIPGGLLPEDRSHRIDPLTTTVESVDAGPEPPLADQPPESRKHRRRSSTSGAATWVPRAATILCIVSVIAVVLWRLHPSLLLSTSIPTGGDNGGHYAMPAFLRSNLLPHGQLTGWDPGWYDGFPLYTYYFVLSDLIGALLSYIVPYALAFKWITILGSLLLPVAAWAMGRLFGLRRAFPGALAAFTLCYLFDYTYTIYGGNLFSTLAGEYAYSLSIALALVFLGLMARGLRTGKHPGGPPSRWRCACWRTSSRPCSPSWAASSSWAWRCCPSGSAHAMCGTPTPRTPSSHRY